ncbi:C40 family peptidase [Natronogracilivirga saccharolytica]|uniref:C40 family peptidase n=1 Tax=Natronogracilivirga saccharolytica TaxID=2812953 RepID=A0A8J7UU11_9BACT|nr:C40 family peptidase [Natronogracilivirga saccharolytica]MBP3193131.1 C40 family peptidase [Natronogracilivirga saccharolytica]
MNESNRHGVARIGVVPVRNTPSETSEMVNQLLLGETMRIVSGDEVWTRVVADFDGYEGWVSSNQITSLTSSEFEEWTQHPARKRFPFHSTLAVRPSHRYVQVPAGAYVPLTENGIEWFGDEFRFQSEPDTLAGKTVIETAMGFLGVSYLWGGRTDNGIDCSGFIQTAHMLHDITVPRDSSDQYEAGHRKGVFLNEADPGDIIFFKYQDRPVTHIGFYLGEGLLLHASGQVRIDQINTDFRSDERFQFNESLSEGLVGIIRPFQAHSLNDNLKQ